MILISHPHTINICTLASCYYWLTRPPSPMINSVSALEQYLR